MAALPALLRQLGPQLRRTGADRAAAPPQLLGHLEATNQGGATPIRAQQAAIDLSSKRALRAPQRPLVTSVVNYIYIYKSYIYVSIPGPAKSMKKEVVRGVYGLFDANGRKYGANS